MSWIKENKFIAALAGGTLVGVIALYFVGSQGAKRYEEAKEKFEAASAEAMGFEKLPLYPRTENLNEKRKALEDYKQSLDSLQTVFEPFRPQKLENITPQEFTSRLLAANEEIRQAFEEAGTEVPEPFFVGFERYRTTLASGSTTGLLDYQLSAIKDLMLELAKAAPSELRNLHRPALAEEDGQAFKPAGNAVARELPLEITFTGPEKSVRQFLSSITKPENKFVVIRTLRIANEKKDPPRAADAKFDKPAAAKPSAGADIFAGGFVLPGEEAPAEEAAEPAAEAAPEPEVTPADTGRILAQVLGDEEVQVFLRLDLLQFLPSKKLP